MKIKFHPTEGSARGALLPFPECDFVYVPGACAKCGAKVGGKFKVQGRPGSRVRTYNTYESDARCVACQQSIGKLVATVSTIFGIEEDERVILYGRPRVY